MKGNIITETVNILYRKEMFSPCASHISKSYRYDLKKRKKRRKKKELKKWADIYVCINVSINENKRSIK
jgi:hypothetical protein